MPLDTDLRDRVLTYCDAHLPPKSDVEEMFSFIDDEKLRNQLVLEYFAARYIYKLGEAFAVEEDRLKAHIKFQIVQYAGIYEAVIVYLLWEKYADHIAISEIEYHKTYKLASSMPKGIQIVNSVSGDEVLLCYEAKQKTSRISIKFDDKVDAAVKIGFVDSELGEEIKEFYKLRNAIHIENALKNDINYELDHSLLAYRRIMPFTNGVKGFLKDGILPEGAKIKTRMGAGASDTIRA